MSYGKIGSYLYATQSFMKDVRAIQVEASHPFVSSQSFEIVFDTESTLNK